MSRLTYRLTEKEIIKIWQHQLLDKTGLITEDSEPIEVIYPGRHSNDQGADFQDAVIATSQGLVKVTNLTGAEEF